MFDWLFNYPKSDFDAGTFTFASSLDTWLLAGLILIAAVLLGWSLWRRRSQLSSGKLSALWVLQTLVAAIILTLIWRPTLKVDSISAGENSVAVLLDSSASRRRTTGFICQYAGRVWRHYPSR